MIRLRGIAFAYDGAAPVIEGVDLDIEPGLTLLVGPNGCGKSTLLKIVAGVEKPDAGSVEIEGRDLWVEEAAARMDLAYVPEQPDLTPYATIEEVLRLVCRLRGEDVEKGREALAITGLEQFGSRSVRELSMGQRRRAVLAAAMVGAPATLLLDEPLEAMDRGMKASIMAWIERRRESGGTIVVVTHDIEPFAAAASCAVTIHGRRALRHGPLPDEPGARQTLLDVLARG